MRSTSLVLMTLLSAPASALAAAVQVLDSNFDLADYDVVEIETGDVTPLPKADGIGRMAVTRGTPGSTGASGDGFLRIEIEGYDTTGSTGYGQIAAVVLRKPAIDPAAAGGFASITYAESSRLVQGGGQGQTTGVVVRQGTNVYIKAVAYTPEKDWTRKRSGDTPVLPSAFTLLQGPGPSATPDLSASGAPFQIGFFRANSGPAPSPGGLQVNSLDDLAIVLQPACGAPAECGDDGSPCTIETCTAGVCSAPVKPCDDGNPCTRDGCDEASGACVFPAEPDGTQCVDENACDGTETCQLGTCTEGPALDCDDRVGCTVDSCGTFGCQHVLAVSFDGVEDDLLALVDRIVGSTACGDEPLAKQIRKKLRKKLKLAVAKLRKADATGRVEALTALLAKADGVVAAARQLVDVARAAGTISPECAADLSLLLLNHRYCIAKLPRVPT